MRAMHGNTHAKHGTRVAWWNARHWDGGGEKWAWVRERLAEHAIDVMVLVEVSATPKQLAALQARAERRGFDMRKLAGELVGGAGGIVVLINRSTVRWEGKPRRLAAKLLSLDLRSVVHTAPIRLAVIHGDPEAWVGQLQALRGWARCGGRALVVGDWNAVPCATWRCSHANLNPFDKAIRQLVEFECECCPAAEDDGELLIGGIVGGCGSSAEPRWTRFHCSQGRWGAPTSRIDYAVTLGGDDGWALEGGIPAETMGEDGRARPLSDHLLQMAWLRAPADAINRERRPTGVKEGRSGKAARVRQVLDASLAEGGLSYELADDAEGVTHAGGAEMRSVAKALVQRGRRAEHEVTRAREAMQATRLRAGGGFQHAKQRYFDWKAILHAALRERAKGVRASDVCNGRLYHVKRGLREALVDGWARVMRRCRAEVSRAARQVNAIRNRDNATLAEAARGVLRIPADDVEARQRAAFKMIYRTRGSVCMDGMHVQDEPAAEFVHHTDERFERVSRQVGELFVNKLDRGCVPLAFDAWLDMFVGRFEEIEGLDGLPWEIRKELTFKVFNGVVDSMPVKAVGAGGFSISLLKRAPPSVRKVVWEAMVGDVTRGVCDPDWRRVMYALLVKPAPNRPDVVHERREIALMAVEMKLLLQCVRRTSYARLAGRVNGAAMGWLATYGCADLGICAAHATDQARLLKHEIYMLYVDLATFFPKIQRGPCRAAKLAHGLPRVVVDLAAFIYGRGRGDPGCVSCQYDSAGGLGGKFKNHMGALMGCVLSTEDARIFLNSMVTAIFAVARGIRLWGYASTNMDRTWEELCQLVLADDWLGCFTRPKEVRRAWAMLSAWEPCAGTEIGIKAAAKTVLTGARWSPDGRALPIGLLRLCTADGRVVPVIGAHEAYKHLGRMRRADGSCSAEKQAFVKKVKHAIALIRGMRRPTRYALMLVSDALIVGLGGFYLQTLHITWEEAEKLEACWRRAANRALRRRGDSPRLEFYLPGAGRTHLFAVNLTAKIGAGCRAMSDVDGTPQRGAARSALAMASSRWGCCGNPATWKLAPIARELEGAMAHPQHRTFGEGWLLAWALCEGQADPEDEPLENYLGARPRFVLLEEDAALAANAAHFASPRTHLLGEGGLGLDAKAALVCAGVLSVGQMCMKRVDGRVEVMSSEAAIAQGVELASTSDRAAWDRVADEVREAMDGATLEVESRRRLGLGWRDGAPSDVQVDLHKVAQLKASMAAEAERERRGLPLVYKSKTCWARLLRDAMVNVPAPSTAEWKHGLHDAVAAAEGPRIVRVSAREGLSQGAEQWWFDQGAGDEVDSNGWFTDWATRAAQLHHRFLTDDSGYVCWRHGSRIAADEMGGLPPMVQLHARARLALGEDVPLVSGPPRKWSTQHVNVDVASACLHEACVWQARLRIEEAFTIDGGKVVVPVGKGQVTSVAYAVIRHDGLRMGGVISDSKMEPYVHELDLPGTSYLAELAAQVCVGNAAHDQSHVFVYYDAQSPEAAIATYRRAHARRAREKLARGWLSKVVEQEGRLRLKAYGWQASHVGAPHNEWVDAAVAGYAEGWQDGDRSIGTRWSDVTSVRFPTARTSMLQWAKPRADRVVVARLQAAVRNTLYMREGDAKLGQLTEQEDRALRAAAARWWALADEGGGGRAEDRAHRAAVPCPGGCTSRCDSFHLVYECSDCALVYAREALCATLERAVDTAELECRVGYHDEAREALAALREGLPGATRTGTVRAVVDAARDEGETELRTARDKRDVLTRAMAGHFYCGTGGAKIRAQATAAAKAAASMLLRGESMLAGQQDAVAQREAAQRTFRRYVATLRARVDMGGTRRAACMRGAATATVLIRVWRDSTARRLPMDLCDAWVPEARRLRLRARRVGISTGGTHLAAATAWLEWWALARLLGWRLRARRSTRTLVWLDAAAIECATAGEIVATETGAPHGANVRRVFMAVVRALKAAGSTLTSGWRAWLHEWSEHGEARLEAMEVANPREFLGWARERLPTQAWKGGLVDDGSGSLCTWLEYTPAHACRLHEERLRARAAGAGQRERRLRRAGKRELAHAVPRPTGIDTWRGAAERGGQGGVTRPPGSWDHAAAGQSGRVARKVERRSRKRDRFRAAKGEAADRDGTWGFDSIEQVRVVVPRRVKGGERVLEALVLWRGEWAELQRTWELVNERTFPGRTGKRTRQAIISGFANVHGTLACEADGRGDDEAGAPTRPRPTRAQPERQRLAPERWQPQSEAQQDSKAQRARRKANAAWAKLARAREALAVARGRHREAAARARTESVIGRIAARHRAAKAATGKPRALHGA